MIVTVIIILMIIMILFAVNDTNRPQRRPPAFIRGKYQKPNGGLRSRSVPYGVRDFLSKIGLCLHHTRLGTRLVKVFSALGCAPSNGTIACCGPFLRVFLD